MYASVHLPFPITSQIGHELSQQIGSEIKNNTSNQLVKGKREKSILQTQEVPKWIVKTILIAPLYFTPEYLFYESPETDNKN